MKSKSFLVKTSICLTALVVCLAFVAGCGGSSGYKKSDSTTAKMDSLAYELKQAKAQIGVTVQSLNQVVAMRIRTRVRTLMLLPRPSRIRSPRLSVLPSVPMK